MKIIFRAFVLFWKSFFVTFAKVTAFMLAVTAFFVLLSVMLVSADPEQSVTNLEGTTPLLHYSGQADSENKIAVIPIHGLILTEQSTDPLSSWFETQVTYGYDVKQLLHELADKDEIKAIFLHLDTPGGTVVGSKAIADGVALYKEKTGKPVYAYVSGMAASGGYWAMAGADKIVADTGTSIGSIGVIYGPFKFYDGVTEENFGAFTGGVVTQDGIDTSYITAGIYKDVGSPYREMTAEEQAILQEGVDDAYTTFVDHVSKGREIAPDDIRFGIGAMIYGEQQAGRLGLIDAVGSKETAQADLLTTLGIEGEDFEFIMPASELGFLEGLMSRMPNFSTQKVTGSGCPLASVAMAYHGNLAGFCH